MATEYNWPGEHWRGDTIGPLVVTVTKESDGLAVDLTGAAIRAEFRQCSKTGPVVLSMSVGDGITITDATGGIFSLDAFRTDVPQAGDIYYDIEITEADAHRSTPVWGTLTLNTDVTR